MKFLVFQHIDVEHPGIFRDFMRDDGITWDVVRFNREDVIPIDLESYNALFVMGGPMDVWQEDKYPWLKAEKAAIRRFVTELKRPYLGLCLGHQLLADALGGHVGLLTSPEVGVMDVELTGLGKNATIFNQINTPLRCLQWHGAGVTEAPQDSLVLASSKACPIQALQVGEYAFSMQFHIEITEKTVTEWASVSEYQQSLETVFGDDGVSIFDRLALNHMQSFNQTALSLYKNFIGILQK